MPGRQPNDWGISLWEAIERWTPKELWQRYRKIKSEDFPNVIFPSRPNPLRDEAARLRAQIGHDLREKLRRGELIASGIALPLTETSRRRDIRPELWPLLRFTSRFQMVTNGGLRYDQILIRDGSTIRHEAPAKRQDASRPQVLPRRASRPAGRPSLMPEIEAELRRRAAVGLIETSSLREAEALAAWAEQQFADAHVPQPKSIQKKLGRLYQELKATNRPDK